MSEDGPTDDDGSNHWDSGGSQALQERLSFDEVHSLLSNERRRAILSYLQTCPEETVPIDDIVAILCQSESPMPGPATHRERIEIDVYHVQLPALDKAGVVEFYPEEDLLQYDGSEHLEAHLELHDRASQGDEYSSP